MSDGWSHTSPAQQIVLGASAADALGELLRVLGVRRALLVTTSGRASSESGERIVAQLGRVHAATFDSVEPHVPAPVIQRGVAQVRESGIDGLVSLGGGSAVDTAKALAFFAEQEGGTPGSGFADRPMLPHVAVPTTLVGAPYTSTFSMVDPHARRSTSAGGPTTTPSAVVHDLRAHADLEGSSLVASVVVALAHGIDAAWLLSATPEARALALAGIAQLTAAGSSAVDDPTDLDRRRALVEAATLCGRARQNAGDGLQQALAQLVGARADVPHAAAHTALVAHTTRFVAEAVPQSAVTAVDRALGGDTGSDPADAVGRFLDRVGAARGLADLGVSVDDLDAVARQSGSHRGVQLCPRPVGEADVRALLEDAS